MRNEIFPGGTPPVVTPVAKPPVTLLRTATIVGRRGTSRSGHYAEIAAGLFVRPIAIGKRATATPDYEVDALIAARISGKSNDEIRELVKSLEAARKSVA